MGKEDDEDTEEVVVKRNWCRMRKRREVSESCGREGAGEEGND